MSITEAFIDKLLSSSFQNPDRDIKNLCNIWLDATQSDWVWLWIENGYTGIFELRKHLSKNNKTFRPSIRRSNRCTSREMVQAITEASLEFARSQALAAKLYADAVKQAIKL